MNHHQPLVIDVRSLLERGIDPFSHIMAARAHLESGQALHLQAPFEPLPLYAIFETAGYTVDALPDPNGGWHVMFTPQSAPTGNPLEMDLRHLEPPDPLIHALKAASRLGRTETLVIHTRFRPVHLIEKLGTTGFECESEEQPDKHWISHIWRLAGCK
jgi:uncharacterized protein (DUF2249 family)